MSSAIAQRLRGAEPVRAIERMAPEGPAWIVGGAVRDAALDAPIDDVDFAVQAGSSRRWALTLAKALGAAPFRLSAEFDTWRVAARDGSWTADFSELRDSDIEADLRLRDFTINALALPVGAEEVLDPLGGLADLEAGRLVAASDRAFEDDPLRLMRAARQSAELGLAPVAETVELGRRSAARAADPAAERTYTELRLLVDGPDPVAGLAVMAALGVEEVVLPELHGLRGVSQGPYHHLGAYEHSLEVLVQAIELERGSADEQLGASAAESRQLLSGVLGDGISRSAGLRFAALLHDVGKAETRTVMPGGKVGFPGHDSVGRTMVAKAMRRLRASRAVGDYVADLTAGHLRLGFMVHRRPLSEHEIHGYLRAAHPWAVDLTLLTVADRLATRGRKAEPAIAAHLDLATLMLERALAWERQGPPRLPLRGGELAAELGIEEGPELGHLLERLEADAYAGEVGDRDALLSRARDLLG